MKSEFSIEDWPADAHKQLAALGTIDIEDSPIKRPRTQEPSSSWIAESPSDGMLNLETELQAMLESDAGNEEVAPGSLVNPELPGIDD